MEPLIRRRSSQLLSPSPSPVRVKRSYKAYSVSGGAGGYGTRISTSSIGGQVDSGYRAYSVSGGAGGYGTRISTSSIGGQVGSGFGSGFGLGGVFDYQALKTLESGAYGSIQFAYSVIGGAGGSGTRISTSSIGGQVDSGYQASRTLESGAYGSFQIGNEKAIMNHLNERLASYLETVRNLEQANQSLEIKIKQVNRGATEERDYGKYNAIIDKLRAKILEMTKGNAQLAIALDNARITSNDFKLKLEYEVSMRMAVEADMNHLRRHLDDTNVTRLHLETDIESLNEEKIILRKNHEEDVAELHGQISHTVQVDVDAPKGQDLARIMEEMREKYEKIVLQNQRELKAWHESQVIEVKVQVTENSAALKEANTMVTETRRKRQALEIELQSQLSQFEARETYLREINMRNNMEMERYNGLNLDLQAELTQIRTDIQQHTRDYEILLNIRSKLEAEIAEYRRLLGEGTEIEDPHHLKTKHTKVVTTVTTRENGMVVSETQDVKSSEEVVD